MTLKIVLYFRQMFLPFSRFPQVKPQTMRAEAPVTDSDAITAGRCWTTASSPCPWPSPRRRPAPCGSCTTTSPPTSRPRSSRPAAWTRCRHRYFCAMTKYFPQLYDRLVAASTGGGGAVSDEVADTPTSRYLLANTGGVEHPSNCPAQCVKVRAAGRWVSVSGGN